MTSDATSRTVATYQRLRRDILAGRLEPDRKLKIQDLSNRLGVSPSVIRESLSRLLAESLVVAEPQRGFRVAPIAVEDIRDLTEVRIDIESKCLRRSIGAGGLSWEVGIVAAQHELARTPYDIRHLTDEWRDAHARFHHALVAACDSIWLLRVREQLFVQGERYRWVDAKMLDENRDLRAEHDEIAASALRRDVARAVELMTAHLRMTEELNLKALASHDIQLV